MKKVAGFACFLLLMSTSLLGQAADPTASAQITPQALVRMLQSNQRSKLLILNVGPHILYAQAHIEGAEFIGPGSDPRAIEVLKNRVKSEPKTRQIVIYCGCCPWDRCPNIHPAFAELKKLGFTNVKVLYIANNIGMDWVDKGYPTTRGQ